MNIKGIIEGLLFVTGDEGINKEKIIEVTNITEKEFINIIEEMQKEYSENNRGIKIEILGNNLKLVTKREYKEYFQKLIDEEDNKLTQSNLETLAIIAYNEPITRIQIDEIRGVSSAHIVRKLLMKDLIMEVGRSDLPGRPILYKTTNYFLDHFGLSSASDLPKIEIEKNDIDQEEKELFQSKYKEN